jgi:hypothetical protein
MLLVFVYNIQEKMIVMCIVLSNRMIKLQAKKEIIFPVEFINYVKNKQI